MVSEFKKYVEDNDVPKIGIAKRTTTPELPAEEVEIIPVPAGAEEYESDSRFVGMDWSQVGVQDS